MSSRGIHDVLNRALVDQEFRHAVKTDPETALADFDLTAQERAAIGSRNYAQVVMAEMAGVADPAEARMDPQRLGDIVVIYNITETLSVTPIIYLNTENVIAMAPDLNVSRRAELAERGDAIVQMPGDRIGAIKEMLGRMR